MYVLFNVEVYDGVKLVAYHTTISKNKSNPFSRLCNTIGKSTLFVPYSWAGIDDKQFVNIEVCVKDVCLL